VVGLAGVERVALSLRLLAKLYKIRYISYRTPAVVPLQTAHKKYSGYKNPLFLISYQDQTNVQECMHMVKWGVQLVTSEPPRAPGYYTGTAWTLSFKARKRDIIKRMFMIITTQVTAKNRVVFDKLIDAQVVRTFPPAYGTSLPLHFSLKLTYLASIVIWYLMFSNLGTFEVIAVVSTKCRCLQNVMSWTSWKD